MREDHMPWPLFFLAGAAKAAAHATGLKLAAGTAKGAAAKGAAGKGSAKLPPGATTVAKKVVKSLGSSDDDDQDSDKDER
jgi:hypothetical protein